VTKSNKQAAGRAQAGLNAKGKFDLRIVKPQIAIFFWQNQQQIHVTPRQGMEKTAATCANAAPLIVY
jgi:hypothetical protein